MSKTLHVIRFEVVRNLKKPSFWLAAILLPVLLGGYVAIAALAGYNAEESMLAGSDTSNLKLAVVDEAKYLPGYKFINSEGQEQELEVYEDYQKGIADVKDKKIDVLYYLPADFKEKPRVEIHTKPDQTTLLDDFSMPIRSLLSATAIQNVDSVDYLIITGALDINTTSYDAVDDHVVNSDEIINNMIAPGIALVLFYTLIVVLGNRIIAAMTEEKENRISELVLTSINPENLVTGKIISLMILGLIQLAVLIIPIIVFLIVAQKWDAIPIDLSVINLDPASIATYVVLLLMSYLLFTGLCVAIGSASPTAKDANSFSSAIVILTILPLFFINGFMKANPEPMIYFLSYFPPSAPLALMFRGIFNTLPTWELMLGIADITLFGILSIKLSTYIFRRFAVDFTSKVSFKNLFNNPRKTWKK